jgi:hypothetical protein
MWILTAFLYSTLEEEIYMEQPKGYDLLEKTMKSLRGSAMDSNQGLK